jgi:RNase P/RNase MRP subunit p30
MEQLFINEKDFNKIRRIIRENPKKEIVFSGDDELSRKVLEKEKINILLINQKGRKDYDKERNSGFNQVLAKLAKKKNVIIGINLDEIIESDGKERARIIARIKQNIKICNKNKLYMEFISFNYKKSQILKKGLGLILGMPTWMTKKLK